MSDEPGHQAMLYFLEVLMNSSGQLSISQLAGRFGSANFSQEMRNASGGNEAGLKQFLARYPSLFTIRGNTVSLCDGREDEVDTDIIDTKIIDNTSEGSRTSETGSDAEAVEFFRSQMLKREEFWVPIKSLAGHLSQTTNEIRNMVGPQLEFKKWLQSHSNVFNVDTDNVSLRDSRPPPSPASTRRITFDLGPEASYTHVPPKTPPPQRKTPRTPSSLYRSQSFGDKLQNTGLNGGLGAGPKVNNTPITMSAAEYKTIMKLKELLEKKGRTKVLALAGCLCGASDTILGSCTAPELESFVLRFPEIFILTSLPNDASCIELVRNAKLSVVVTGRALSGTIGSLPGTTRSGRGQIFHVARLWGIVDLGEHEHVFFDKSILPVRPGQPMVEDLLTRFKVGEWLNFEAVMAHKSSRARWRAISVWKDDELSVNKYANSNSVPNNLQRTGVISPDGKIIEAEVNEFLPRYKGGGGEFLPQYNGNVVNGNDFLPAYSNGAAERKNKMVSFEDAVPSGAGAVPIWNFKQDESKDRPATMCLVPEAYQMSVSALSDLKFAPDLFNSFLLGGVNRPVVVSASDGVSKDVGVRSVSVGCQTVSTGDIIATQLYQDA